MVWVPNQKKLSSPWLCVCIPDRPEETYRCWIALAASVALLGECIPCHDTERLNFGNNTWIPATVQFVAIRNIWKIIKGTATKSTRKWQKMGILDARLLASPDFLHTSILHVCYTALSATVVVCACVRLCGSVHLNTQTHTHTHRYLCSSLKLFKNVSKGKQQSESCRQVCDL